MPQAPTTESVARARQQGGQPGQSREPVGTNGGNVRVEAPSAQWQTHQPGDFLRISVPANWEQVKSGNTVMFVPDGGYVRARQRTVGVHPRPRDRRDARLRERKAPPG